MSVAIAVIDNKKAYLVSDQQVTDMLTLQANSDRVLKQEAFNSYISVAFIGTYKVAKFILSSMKGAHELYGIHKYDYIGMHEMGAVLDDYISAYIQRYPDDDSVKYAVTALISGIDENNRPMIAQWNSVSRTFNTCYHNNSDRPTVVFLRPTDISEYELAVMGDQLMHIAMHDSISEYLRQYIELIAGRSQFVSREYSFWECGIQE